jgi:hypothetical protein
MPVPLEFAQRVESSWKGLNSSFGLPASKPTPAGAVLNAKYPAGRLRIEQQRNAGIVAFAGEFPGVAQQIASSGRIQAWVRVTAATHI